MPSDKSAPPEADHDAHEGPIKSPKQLVVAVIAAFVVPITIIILLASYVDFGSRTGAGSDALEAEAVASRIQPIGAVEIRDASGPAVLRTGEQVFTAQCAACHAAGLAGAPKLGDAALWAPRIKTGYAALLHSALVGKGAMGPQGGGEFTDLEIGRGVVFMANQSGAKFADPQPPAPGAAASAAPVAASGPN